MIMIYFLAFITIVLSGFYLYLRKVWFYRDPVRYSNGGPGDIISPADGQVIYVEPVKKGIVVSKKLGEPIPIDEITKMPLEKKDGWLIGIYMSPLDVHFNYAPVEGLVTDIAYTPAKANLPMVDFWEYIKMAYLRKAVNLISKKYRLVNERNTVLFNGEDSQMAIIEIADKFVSKIKVMIEKGQKVKAGQKIGFIDRGSQVDLIIFNKDIDIKVEIGQQVYGAKTVLAALKKG